MRGTGQEQGLERALRPFGREASAVSVVLATLMLLLSPVLHWHHELPGIGASAAALQSAGTLAGPADAQSPTKAEAQLCLACQVGFARPVLAVASEPTLQAQVLALAGTCRVRGGDLAAHPARGPPVS